MTTSPWDDAHDFAKANGYAYFVEPDVLHETLATGEVTQQMDAYWPPKNAVSAGWHLEKGFTGFAGVRSKTTGVGVRIAHLDTGYTPGHFSNPRHLRTDLGKDFWNPERGSDASDPGSHHLGEAPGHGTGTLALLAGGKVDLPFNGAFNADIGGAPDAEIVPVRINASFIHLYTSTMARGIDYALAPGGDAANRCDVISISHGGLPSRAWATAVNKVYDAGIIVVAASGDSIRLVANLPTRYTVYPAAFNRVLTALGATYDKKPYIAGGIGPHVQGNWGPAAVMEKAIAGYTPNVVWMDYKKPNGFSMSGAGTSSSTPQIAAACALWLSLYGGKVPQDWRRVEACRVAMFKSAAENRKDVEHLGWGILDVPGLLDETLASQVIAMANGGQLHKSGKDEVSFPFWRLLFGIAPPNSAEERMYEAEVAQVVSTSVSPDLVLASQAATSGKVPTAKERAAWVDLLLAEKLSSALTQQVQSIRKSIP